MEDKSSAAEGASPHPRIVAALLVVATLIAFLAIFSIWVNRQALNTDNWVSTSDKLLQNEEIKTQLSNYLADELFANVDVQAELEKTFPPRLAPLAGPAAGALHQLAPKVAERALETSQAESLWSSANRGAHETLLKILNDEGSAVSTGGGEVTLDLKSLLSESGGQLGIAGKLASKVPPDAGQLTILKSDQLSQRRTSASWSGTCRSSSPCWRSCSTGSRSTSPGRAVARRCARSASASSSPVFSASSSDSSPETR